MNQRFKQTSLILGFTLLAASFQNEAEAFRKFLNQFSDHYESNGVTTNTLTDENSCGLCHVRAGGGGRRNPYGEDFRNVALGEGQGFPGIEFLDSDSDGFNNLEEIYLQVHPGKPENAPQKRIELSIDSQSVLFVRVDGNCNELNLKAFGLKFENDQTDLTKQITTAPLELKVTGSKGAILAKCDDLGAAGSLLIE